MKSTYKEKHFESIQLVDEKHFWFRTRNLLIGQTVESLALKFDASYSVLEVGCGTGVVLCELVRRCGVQRVIGLELFRSAAELARARAGCDVVVGDVHKYEPGRQFQMIGFFDVLEHIEDDVKTLARSKSLLADEGAILITVPALPFLWSNVDVAAQHFRRYTRKTLEAALMKAGYRVVFVSYFMMPLVPFMYAKRLLRKRISAFSGEASLEVDLNISSVANKVAHRILLPETAWVIRRHHVPIGTSLFAIAMK